MSNTDSNRPALRCIFSIVGEFRELDTEMTCTQGMMFLWIALNEGKTQRELRVAFEDMPSSTASRNLAALSKVHRLGKKGLGLIDWVEDPADRRAKQLVLTPKGRSTTAKLVGLLN